MAFALQLKGSLHLRENQVPVELATGDPLSVVLARDLLAVEASADTDMLTSILLLDGSTLRHCAAPNLPAAYCSAIDGLEIGPRQGSCGTAAFFGRPVYVTDIDTDPLWVDYRELALAHGLRACWSTPIFNDQAAVIGTFAIYHLAQRAPTPDEVKAIETITDHVARAIMWSNRPSNAFGHEVGDNAPLKPVLKLVTANHELPSQDPYLLGLHECSVTDAAARNHFDLLDIANRFDAISCAIDAWLDLIAADEPDSPDVKVLQRAKMATQKGAALTRSILAPKKRES